MKHQIFLFAILMTILPAGVCHAQDDPAGLPDYAREYLAANVFAGIDPGDPLIDGSVDIITIPESMREYISQNDWERGQLAIFGEDKLHVLALALDGTAHSIVFRDGKKRKDKVLDDAGVRVLRRLYSTELWETPPDALLQAWLDREELDAEERFAATVALCEGQDLKLDAETMERASANYNAEATRTEELARALGALADSPYAVETAWAALWLISRMDNMHFYREVRENSVCDLATVDAQLFYENVFYAVKAREEFAVAADVSDDDFLQQVLSPRQTGEPLQRWRRHFYFALEPEVSGLAAAEFTTAISLANAAYDSFYQYEGATTWEDFGMLTALAVHEGRCEDCSNVNNAMLRAIGLPGCQAYTPWWGHTDGNHAWTWIRGVGDPPGDGKNGVKVYVKTWDGRDDVTAEYTPVTVVELETAAVTEDKAALMVWNHDEWRTLAEEPVADGKVVFNDVGCRLDQSLCIRVPGEDDRICDLRTDGSYRWLDLGAEPGDAETFTVDYDKSTPFGEMDPGEDYNLLVYTIDGWVDSDSERLSTGGFTFEGTADRLYRIVGPGIASRPFTVEPDETGEVVTLRR